MARLAGTIDQHPSAQTLFKSMSTSSFSPFRRVVVIYSVVAFLWIWLSDRAVDLLFHDHGLYPSAQTWKGWLFVGVTTVFLYVLLRRLHGQIQRAAALETASLRREAHTAALLNALADGSGEAIFAKDLEGRYLLFNREAAYWTGQAPENVLGRDDRVLFPEEQVQVIQANDRRVMAQNSTQTFQEVLDTRQGQRICLATKGPLHDENGVRGMFGITRDITAMVVAQRQLESSERGYRLLFEANPHPMWVFDRATLRFLAVNEAAMLRYGYERSEFLGMTIEDIRQPKNVPVLRQMLADIEQVNLRDIANLGVWTLRAKDGGFLEVEILTSKIDFEGHPARLVLAQDVMERNRVARERDAAHQQLQAVLSRITDAFMSTDIDQRLVYVNDKVALLAGRASPDEMLGQVVWDVFPEAVGTPFEAAYWRACATGQLTVAEDWYPPWGLWLEVRLFPSGEGVSAYITDISDRKRSEQALLQSQNDLTKLSTQLMAQERLTARRIGQALHDHLGQQLGSARLYLDVAMAQAAAADPATPARDPLAQVSALLDGAIAEVRHVLRDMRPPLLEDQGLAAALDNELRLSPAQDMGLHVALELGAAVRGLRWPDAVEYASFMIAREAIGNAVRHAQGSCIRVSLDGEPGHLSLRIEDDGVGLEPADLQGRPGHLGMLGMRERAAAMGARLAIERGAYGGTVVALTLEVAP
ncbi:PAS domain S-box protein [Hydrogenophaga sp.]|uniref:sensor histidine kinase n=1 Tax=Hydrogenophaga sp. TaxID=1904254 RepID=UPI003F6D2673